MDFELLTLTQWANGFIPPTSGVQKNHVLVSTPYMPLYTIFVNRTRPLSLWYHTGAPQAAHGKEGLETEAISSIFGIALVFLHNIYITGATGGH